MDKEQTRALGAAATLVAAVLWPLRQQTRAQQRDGFPLSCYPMFTAKRRRSGTVVHLVGVSPGGTRSILSHRLAGHGGMNQVRRQLNLAVRTGRADQVVGQVARRPEVAGLAEVRLVSGTYRYDDFFAGDRTPVREVVHARALVG